MKTEKLNEAIAYVRAGRNEDARQILFEYIRDDPENEVAWIWLAETLSSNQDRMKIYQACLDLNPDSKIVNMAISRLKSVSDEDFPEIRRVSPFTEDGTFDPSARERTGHTGALIGQDGSFILTNVPDFDEVIDLRRPVDKILDDRLSFMMNPESDTAKTNEIGESNTQKELDYEPDLSELLDDEIFATTGLNSDTQADEANNLEEQSLVDKAEQDELAALFSKRLSNEVGTVNLHEAETTRLEKSTPESLADKDIEPEFTPSMGDSFLKDDQTGDLVAPDEAFSYDFGNEKDIELDYEPDLSSFLANEKIDVDQRDYSWGSVQPQEEESEDEIDLEDIPLEDELSVEELGFGGLPQKSETELEAEPEEKKPGIVPPPPPVEKELADEFAFDEVEEVDTKTKRTKREMILIGGTALLLLLALSVISVFAFPGVFGGISRKSPTPTFAGILLQPTAEKIVLPPVNTSTLPLSAIATQISTETPVPTVSETAVVILLPSATPTNTATATVTPTGTRRPTLIPTRTRTPTNTNVPSNTRTPTPSPTNTLMNTSTPTYTSVPPTNTPTVTRTLIPTITPTYTNTPLPPTSTPVPPTNTPLPPPTDTPFPTAATP